MLYFIWFNESTRMHTWSIAQVILLAATITNAYRRNGSENDSAMSRIPSTLSVTAVDVVVSCQPSPSHSILTLTPGRTRNIDQDMEALRLSRQDNPFLQVRPDHYAESPMKKAIFATFFRIIRKLLDFWITQTLQHCFTLILKNTHPWFLYNSILQNFTV